MSTPARRLLAGTAVSAILAAAAAPAILADLPRTRTIALYNIHTKESLTVEYMRDGRHVPEAMEKINWLLRDWRKNEPTHMDPQLIDLLWEVHEELGSKEPIHIISGFRSRESNELLRRTVGGQASESRHITGQAADVQFPDVELKRIRYSALVRERGGVGYYPTSAMPFVHIDTGNVRHWPRLPRFELALLFPNGQSRYTPSDGVPITRDDVRIAQAQHRDVAVEVAQFLDLHNHPTTTRVADAGAAAAKPGKAGGEKVALQTAPAAAPRAAAPALTWQASAPPPAPIGKVASAAPRLVAEPRLIDRPSRFAPGPSQAERDKLAQLAALAGLPQLVTGPAPAVRPRKDQPAALPSLTGRPPSAPEAASASESRVAAIAPGLASGNMTDAGWGNGWSVAPAFDEEHPEELSYRPFPVSAYLTATASPDDPALARLVHPDVAKTLEMLDSAGSMPPMRLRPGQQVAQLIWALEFKGEAVAIDRLLAEDDQRSAIPSRRVATKAE